MLKLSRIRNLLKKRKRKRRKKNRVIKKRSRRNQMKKMLAVEKVQSCPRQRILRGLTHSHSFNHPSRSWKRPVAISLELKSS
jgi:hypothetical protein